MRQGALSPRKWCLNSQIQLLASANIVTLAFTVSTTLYIQGRSSLLFPYDGCRCLLASIAFPYLHQYADCLEAYSTSFWLNLIPYHIIGKYSIQRRVIMYHPILKSQQFSVNCQFTFNNILGLRIRTLQVRID